MKAISKFLAGSAAVAALASAAPAAAQFFPGYRYGPANGVGAVITIGGGYNGYAPYGYGVSSRAVANMCANAVQARLAGGYGGYGPYGGGRVLGISRVEQGLAGAVNVHGVATSGGYRGNVPDLTWKCRADQRGAIIGVDVHPAQRAYGGYGYAPEPYTPWNDYSQYGYSRY